MIPDGWETRSLGSSKIAVIDGDRGVSYPNARDFASEGYCLFLTAKNVTKSGFAFEECQFLSKSKHEQLRKGNVLPGDLVLTTRGTVGNVGYLRNLNGFDAVRINSGMVVIRNTEELVDTDYLYALFRAPIIERQIETMNFGSAQPQLTVKIINDLQLPLPALPEQRRIAGILAAWDRAIETVEALIANARAQKTALMQSILTGKHRLPGFSGVWTTQKLGSLCQISKGEQLGRLAMIETGTIPVINGGITASGYTDRANSPADCITISEGGNSCGFVSLMDKPFWCGGHCYALKNLVADRSFLFASLKHREAEIMTLRVGSGLPNIQKKALAGFELNVPPRVEQEAIGKFADTQDGVHASLQSQLTALRQEKFALMQQLLTGKRRAKLTEREAA